MYFLKKKKSSSLIPKVTLRARPEVAVSTCHHHSHCWMLMFSRKEIHPQTKCSVYYSANILTEVSFKEILSYYFNKWEATEEDPIKQRQQEQIQSITEALGILWLKNHRWQDDWARKKREKNGDFWIKSSVPFQWLGNIKHSSFSSKLLHLYKKSISQTDTAFYTIALWVKLYSILWGPILVMSSRQAVPWDQRGSLGTPGSTCK